MSSTHVARFRIAGALLLGLVLPPSALGQEATAVLSGRVEDASGRGLSAVTVTVQSSNVMQTHRRTTEGSGYFAFSYLPAGSYVVTFSRRDLVVVKQIVTLTARESLSMRAVMNINRGDEEAVRLEYPSELPVSDAKTWAVRNVDMASLPVTSAIRSAISLHGEMRGVFARSALVVTDGMRMPAGVIGAAGPGSESLQAVTVLSTGLTGGLGHQQPGAVIIVTKAGANRLSASVRGNLSTANTYADGLREARESDGLALVSEAAVGGPIWRDHVWFYVTANRNQESIEDQAVVSGRSFSTQTLRQFDSAKLTHSWSSTQRIEGQWIDFGTRASNAVATGAARAADVGALDRSTLNDRRISVAYFGRLPGVFEAAARFTTGRHTVSSGRGAGSNDSADRTSLFDTSTGAIWFAGPRCPECGEHERQQSVFRFSAGRLFDSAIGAHHAELGIELDRAVDAPAALPIGGAYQLWSTGASTAEFDARPVFLPSGSSRLIWFQAADARRSHQATSIFLSDHWTPAAGLTVDLGLRFDRYASRLRADGWRLLTEQAVTPRLVAGWTPARHQAWTVRTGYGQYAIQPFSQLDGGPARGYRSFTYTGPAINAGDGASLSTSAAIQQVLDWFAGQGAGSAPADAVLAPGLSTTAAVSTPSRVDEWFVGVGRTLFRNAHARVDLTRRTFTDTAARPVIIGSPALDQHGFPIDVSPASSSTSSPLRRSYAGAVLQASYRLGHYANVTTAYTYSRFHGNTDGMETERLRYPEYYQSRWAFPEGALLGDSRHRLQLAGHAELLAHDTRGLLLVSAIFRRESGHPYGAAGWVQVEPFVVNPGYYQPPRVARYFFTARDAFSTGALSRLDLGISYRKPVQAHLHRELFIEFHVLNLLNSTAQGSSQSGAAVQTALTDPSLRPFNPFVDTPVQDVHWRLRDDAGLSETSSQVTVPRAVRLAFGVRF